MADEEHLKIIRQGVAAWNDWRAKNPLEKEADLCWADLRGADLRESNLLAANLTGANLSGARLCGARLSESNLSGASLTGANLNGASLTGANLSWANLSRANLTGAFLGWADLSRANLSELNLRELNLRGVNLTGANLTGANLTGANLSWANLTGAFLTGAGLTGANLSWANLTGAFLSGAQLIETDLCNATLTGSNVYGVSVWDIKVDDRTKQQDLIITNPAEPVITVDNIKVAQFVYLLLTNKEIRDVIDTITSKAVLILGRFTPPERKEVLDALHTALRKRGFVPITFDFERPTNKDFSETIMTLAGMSCFIIADITNPKSSPLELQATVPNYMVPFVPIIQQGEKPFAMFSDLHNKYKQWVLPPLEYHSSEFLVARLKNAIIEPALEIRRKLALIKAQELPTRNVIDYPEDE